jgi:RNA polymerase sigma-70 factor (ECF subfamily)
MKKVKQDSVQAAKDKEFVSILQNKEATAREKASAFNSLYSRHTKQVKFFFLKRLRDEEISDDLLMITFQKAYENINSYKKEMGAFSTWLYKIAGNNLIDYTRKANFEVLSLDALTKKTVDENYGMEFQLDSGLRNPEEEVVHSEVVAQVHEAINSLDSPLVKELMICRYIEGLSYKEAAKKLGVKDNSTLRISVLRGKEALEKKLFNIREFA